MVKIDFEKLWRWGVLEKSGLYFPEFNLVKRSVILLQDYLIEYKKRKKDYENLQSSLELSFISLYIGLETCLNRLLLEKRKNLKDSRNKIKLISRKATLQEMLNILLENKELWYNSKVNQKLIRNIRESYNLYRIKIMHPNSKPKKRRMFYPFSKSEYLTIFEDIFNLFNKLYFRASMPNKAMIGNLETNLVLLGEYAGFNFKILESSITKKDYNLIMG